jgi:hypothetical protein
MEWVDVAMEEYKTLRQESLGSLEQAQRAVQIGLAAIAAITAFGATSRSAGTFQDAAIVSAGPAVAALVWIIWLLEIERSMRAGRYIAQLEWRINASAPDEPPALGWENKMLGEKKPLGSSAYNIVVPLMLIVTSLPSAAVGVARLIDHRDWGALAVATSFDVVVLVYTARFHRDLERKMDEHRETVLRSLVTNGSGTQVETPLD